MDLALALLLGLLAHVAGDYGLQTSWMAREKLTRFDAAAVHAGAYSVPFVPLLALAAPSWQFALAGWVVVAGTHAVLDRFRVARTLVWARNQLAPARDRYAFATADAGGFAPGTPAHLSCWLTTIVDNLIHVAINSATMWWLLTG